MIICEYDNQGYQNTGSQLSFTVSLGQSTSTSNYGPYQLGKATHHKDTAQIFAACHVPYVCTVAESNPARHDPQGGQGPEVTPTRGWSS